MGYGVQYCVIGVHFKCNRSQIVSSQYEPDLPSKLCASDSLHLSIYINADFDPQIRSDAVDWLLETRNQEREEKNLWLHLYNFHNIWCE